MAKRFGAVDPNGIPVECDDETWSGHILRHAELLDREAWVTETIEEPLAIYQDADYPNRRAFYRPYSFGHTIGRAYLKVVVAYTGNQQQRTRRGVVITAFAALAPKAGERLVWPV
jgi:hypothetical protein